MSNTYPAAPTTSNYSPHPNAQGDGQSQPMDARQGEYAQPGNPPYIQPKPDQPSEESAPDQASAAQYKFEGQNTSATPNSEYGMTPQSARQGQFPEYAQRPPYPDQRYPPSAGQHYPNMAHQQSPSQPITDGATQNHQHAPNSVSDNHVPIDPNIAAGSPTYPPQPAHYPPHYPQHDMHYGPPPMYARPGEYPPPYGHPYQGHYGPPPMMGRPGPPGGGVPLSTVYSFVPIPGTHQQKRPRRRYEEIERMYKCGWNGCEKAYGTLNHLNAHVTMQAHGVKRTPEEFKEIRKEWKQRKKEEDTARKQDDDRARSQGGQPSGQEGGGEGPQSSAGYSQNAGAPRLPPLGYLPAGGQPLQPQPYSQPVDGSAPQYSAPNGQGYYQQGPASPYAGQQTQMYTQAQPPPATGQEQTTVADGA